MTAPTPDSRDLETQLADRTRQVDELRTLLTEVREHSRRELERAAADQRALEEALAASQRNEKEAKAKLAKQQRDLAAAKPYLRARRLAARVKQKLR